MRHRFVAAGCLCVALAIYSSAAHAAAVVVDDPAGSGRLAPGATFLWWAADGGGGLSAAGDLFLIGSITDDIMVPLPVLAQATVNPALSRGSAIAPIEAGGLPTELALAPISPNPARAMARVSWALPSQSNVRLTVLDVQGREVAVLADGPYAPGRYGMTWRPDRRDGAAAGIYFVRLKTPDREIVRRVAVTP